MKRFLLMDADMLARVNIDDAFSHRIMPAGVMRGERNSCLWQNRPAGCYFHHNSTMRQGDTHPRMIGGVNGGLVFFEPNVETYDDMMKELWNWRPHTKMAEQDFLSWFWARNCATVAMHKKYNLQIHQMYFSTPFGTEEGESQNSASRIIQHPDDIRMFHFSADQKPSMILINEMSIVEGSLKMDDHLTAHSEYMMREHGTRNERLQERPDCIPKIEKLLRDEHLQWFDAWKRTYVSVVSFVFQTTYSKMECARRDDGEHLRCPTCGEEWHTKEMVENSFTIRDHLLFHCSELGSKIKIPVKHQTNLTTFFFPPCEPQVESKMLYLAEVFKYYEGMDKSKGMHGYLLNLNPTVDPEIRFPLYMIPKHILATTEDIGVDAATVTGDKKETETIMSRRYCRAIDTIRKIKEGGAFV